MKRLFQIKVIGLLAFCFLFVIFCGVLSPLNAQEQSQSQSTIPNMINKLFTYYASDRPNQNYPFLTKTFGEELFTPSFLNVLYHNSKHSLNGLAALTKDPICNCTTIGPKGLELQSFGIISGDDDKAKVVVTYDIIGTALDLDHNKNVELYLVKDKGKWLIDNIIHTSPFDVREHIKKNGNL